MADIVLNIVTNVDDAANDLNKVKDSMKDVKQEASTSGAAFKSWTSQVESVEDAMSRVAREAKNAGKVSMDVSRNVASGMNTAEKSVKSFMQQTRQMRQQLTQMELAGKGNTEEYRRMSMQLGKVRDAMDDAANKAKFWRDDQRWITASTQAVQGLVGAYSLYAGIMGLVDEEDKDLQKTMQKMQSLMVIMMGLTEVSTMLQKDSIVMTAKRAIVEKLMEGQLRLNAKAEAAKAIATANGTIATKASAGALGALNKVLSGVSSAISGITFAAAAVGVAIGGIAAGFGWLVSEERSAIRYTNEFGDAMQSNKNAIDGYRSALDDVIASIRGYVSNSADATKTDGQRIQQKLKEGKNALTSEIAAHQENINIINKEIAIQKDAIKISMDMAKKGKIVYTGRHIKAIEELEERRKKETEFIVVLKKQKEEYDRAGTAAADYVKKKDEETSAVNKTAQSTKKLNDTKRDEHKINVMLTTDNDDLVVSYNTLMNTIDNITNSTNINYDAQKYAQEIQSMDVEVGKKRLYWTEKTSDAIKRETDEVYELGNALQKAAKWMKESQTDDIIMSSISGIADITEKIADGMTQSIENSINQIDKYISETDSAITEAQSRIDEQLRLQEEGSASNVAIEKKRLEDLTTQREKYLNERNRQIAKERKIEQTMATIKGAVAAIEALASGVSEGGIPGIIVGVLGAAAIIAEMATMYSQAESAIKFAHGNAEILGGNSHAGGGVSLGQYGEAEGGEFLGILSKNKTAKYGKSMLTLFDGINNSNDRKIAAGLMSLTGNIPIGGGSNEVELKEVKAINGMYNIMKQPAKTVIIEGNKRIERNGRNTRIIYN